MEMSIYAIYDDISKVYNTPFYMFNDGMAIRAFKGHVNTTPDSALFDFPEQFKLMKLGTFNDGTGEIESHPPVYIAHGLDVVEEDMRQQDKNVIYELSMRLKVLEEMLIPRSPEDDGKYIGDNGNG